MIKYPFPLLSPSSGDRAAAEGAAAENNATNVAEQKPSFDELIKDDKYKAEYEATLAAERERWTKETAEKARQEGLTAEQRNVEELAAAKARLQELEQAQTKAQLKAAATEALAAKNIPTTFAEMLIGADATATKAQTTAFAETFNAAVNAAVEARLAGTTTPKAGNAAAAQDGVTSAFLARNPGLTI
ncbi:MAG: DUF4355 domain-containing protein [Eubacteriales bacterium]|nr:DUF4355 domain-containing protein [Eubacteriales bacterium]